MTIPVTLGAGRVFEDRVDVVVREAGAVRVSLRLSRAAALALAERLILAFKGDGAGVAVADVGAILEHPEPLASSCEPRAPP